MASGTAQIDQSPLCQHYHSLPIWEYPPVHLILNLSLSHSLQLSQGIYLYLIVKVAYVTYNGIVLHGLDVISGDDVPVASGSHEYVYPIQYILYPHHLKAFHAGLEGTDGIHLSYEHSSPTGLHAHG